MHAMAHTICTMHAIACHFQRHAGGAAARQQQGSLDSEDSCQVLPTSPAVLALLYSPLRAATPGYGGELLDNPKLLVGLMSGIAVIDTHTYDLVQMHYFRGGGQWVRDAATAAGSAPSLVQAAQGVPELGIAGVCAFGVDPKDRHLVCCVAGEYEPEVGVLALVPELHTGGPMSSLFVPCF